MSFLGAESVRLGAMERAWVVAAQQQEFDRTFKNEFNLTDEELRRIKEAVEKVHRQSRTRTSGNDAEQYSADSDPGPRLQYLLFGDAVQERLKIFLIYAPAAISSVLACSIISVLFLLFDGEVVLNITTVGRLRLGLASAVVATLTIWFTNTVTPVLLDYLDLGRPILMKGNCPNCSETTSCLFTSSTSRVRAERRCRNCKSVLAFNRKWNKIYIVEHPRSRPLRRPD
uniref:Uncharacterized protein n=2 Tax=Compsopogon caeruleus TaxID=31354 RepID=A0A7S1TAJ6_9RHOD|mmetsp:Transcript_1479/g.2916  ORF Transcript_1479/g.2916 Transcript_1479/m.2916 type:complete len:228 (+) Transcript_1479:207-890(+)